MRWRETEYMCKVTALKYLNSLKKKGYVDYELVGPTKLWFAKEEEEEISSEEVLKLLREIEKITGRRAILILEPGNIQANNFLSTTRGG